MAGCSSRAACSARSSGKAVASRKLKALRACSSTYIPGSVVNPLEAPGGAIVGEPAERAIAELHIPLVVDPRALGPPLPRRAPRSHAGHDPRREPVGSQMDRPAGGERHAGGQRWPQPAQRERRALHAAPLTPPSPRRGEGPWRGEGRPPLPRLGTLAVQEPGDPDL